MVQADIRDQARRLRGWCTALSALLLVILVLEIASRAGSFDDPAHYHRLGLDLLFAVPTLLQLAALWHIRQGLSEVAAGALFTSALSRMLRQVGLLLLLASLCRLVIAPLLHRLAEEHYPRLIEFDVANLVIGALGLTLIFLGRLFERAVDLKRELDEIF